jgi:serine/threonine protein kinase
MTLKEYCRNIDSTVLSYEGNKISKHCQNFVEGLLERNVNKRFSFNQAINHPWILGIKNKVDDIVSKFQNDPEKMICELNKARVDDEYFNQFVDDSIYIPDDSLINDKLSLNKKRKRNSES